MSSHKYVSVQKLNNTPSDSMPKQKILLSISCWLILYMCRSCLATEKCELSLWWCGVHREPAGHAPRVFRKGISVRSGDCARAATDLQRTFICTRPTRRTPVIVSSLTWLTYNNVPVNCIYFTFHFSLVVICVFLYYKSAVSFTLSTFYSKNTHTYQVSGRHIIILYNGIKLRILSIFFDCYTLFYS